MIKIFAKTLAAFFIFCICICVKDAGAQAIQTTCGSSIMQPILEVRVNGTGGVMPLGTNFGLSTGLAVTTVLMPNPQFSSVINVNGRTINNICLSQRIPANTAFNNTQISIRVIHQCVCNVPQPTYTIEVWSDNPTWMFGPYNGRVPRFLILPFSPVTTLTNDINLWPGTQSGSVFIKTNRVADGIYSCDSRIDEIHINRPLDNRTIRNNTNAAIQTYNHRWNQIVINTSPNQVNFLNVGNIGGGVNIPTFDYANNTNGVADIYITGPQYRSIGNTYINWLFNGSANPPAGFNVPNPNSPYISFIGPAASLPNNLLITASAMGCPINPTFTNPNIGGGLQGPFGPPDQADGNLLQLTLINGVTNPQALRTQQGNIKEQGLSDEGDISINPNPASKNTTIKLPESKKNAQITVVDSKGSVVMKATALTQNTVLNTSALASGTYSVIIRHKNGESTTKKLICYN